MAHALSTSNEALKREWVPPPSITVLDRRRPLRGSTLASTALLQWEIDLPLVHLAKKIGHANAFFKRLAIKGPSLIAPRLIVS